MESTLKKPNILIFILLGVFLGAFFIVLPLKLALASFAGVFVILLSIYYFNISLYAFIVFMAIVPNDYWNNAYIVLAAVFYFTFFAINRIIREKSEFKPKIFEFSFIFFVITVIVGSTTAILPREALRVLLFFTASFMFSIMICSGIKNKKDLHTLLMFIAAAVMFTSFYALYQNYVGVPVDVTLTDLSVNTDMPGRVYSSFGNPNNYAEFLILFFPFLIALMLSKKSLIKKTIYLFVLLFPITALGVTFARSGYIAVAISVLVIIAFYNWKMVPLIVLLGILALPILPSTISNRIISIGNKKDTSSAFRFFIWDGTLKMLKDYWYTGIGGGANIFGKIYPHYADPYAATAPHAHMLWLQIWVEFGIVSLIAFLGYLFSMVKSSLKLFYKNKNNILGYVLIAGVSTIFGISFMGIVEYVWFYPRVMLSFWIVMGIIMGTINLAKKELK